MASKVHPSKVSGPHAPLMGVVRWDGQAGFEKGQVGYEEEIALGPRRWHSRLPFYATEPGKDRCTLRGDTQEIIDKENELARAAGIDYWAFVWYGDSFCLSKARNLHVQSRVKNKVKCCAIVEKRTDAEIDVLVEVMKNQNYQRVLGDRPLVYALNSTPQAMAYLRKRCAEQHLPNPFIAAMEWSGPGAATLCEALGADAISAYTTFRTDETKTPYAKFAAGERACWDSWRETGKQVIPWVTVGWDPRPRSESDPKYNFAPPYRPGYANSTARQYATQLRSCLDWVRDHAEACQANAILSYSWNEFSEGGTLCPKLSGDRKHLDAVSAVLAAASGKITAPGAPGPRAPSSPRRK